VTKRRKAREFEFRRQVEEATRNLRKSTSPLFRRLRELIEGKGIDPSKSALVGIQVDELYAHCGGELTSPNGDHFAFDIKWPDGHMEHAELTQWFKCNDALGRSIGRDWLERETLA